MPVFYQVSYLVTFTHSKRPLNMPIASLVPGQRSFAGIISVDGRLVTWHTAHGTSLLFKDCSFRVEKYPLIFCAE